MPVNTEHPDYAKMAPKWKRMRKVAEGQDAVHEAREEFLPPLSGETLADYEARLRRTPFFNATWRTIEGLRGMLLRKDPDVEVSTSATTMLEDVTKSGVGLVPFVLKVAEEALTLGRVGVMVDYPPNSAAGSTTVRAAEESNLRPHMALYTAEAVINWRVEWIGGKARLARVVLAESYEEVNPSDRFVSVCKPQWRVLELEGGLYVQRVYRQTPANVFAEIVEMQAAPTIDGQRMAFIPFQFIGTDDTTPAIDSPPLLDLANINISHYQTTADLEHGAHKTALPTPWISGVTAPVGPDGKPLPMEFYMGGGHAWVLPAGAEAGMLEYAGTGLGALENRAAAKERQMAILGARMLEEQKSGVEAAETAGIHRSGEQSALATIGSTISTGVQQALSWFDQWAGGDGKVSFSLNDEFFPAGLSAQDLTALVSSWQQGALSSEELFEKLQRGGVIRDDKQFEEHETQVANNPPSLLGGALPLAGKAPAPAAE